MGEGLPIFVIDEDGRRRRFDGTAADLRGEADAGRLSAGALLRPLVAQAALPVAAHVNGPAEIAYFAQLPEAFGVLGLPVPAVLPRPSATILRAKEDEARKILGLGGEAILARPEEWPPAPGGEGPAGALAALRERIAAATAEVRAALPAAALADAHAGFRARSEEAVRRLEESALREGERSAGVGRERRRRLAEWVRPRGRWQERVLGPLVLMRGYDPDRLGRVLARLDPFDLRHHVIGLEPGDQERSGPPAAADDS